MSMLDGLLSQVVENVDVGNLATKVGLSPQMVEQAVSALAQAHPQPGDTVAQASQQTGISGEILQQIVGHIGGEGSLGRFASLLEGQGGGSGGIAGEVAGLASGLFNKS